MSETDKPSWPKTPAGATDWETVFEDPDQGLVALVTRARTAAGLRETASVVIRQLFPRRDDPAEIERALAGLGRMIPDALPADALPGVRDAVAGLLRQVKEDRIARAAEIEAEHRRAKAEADARAMAERVARRKRRKGDTWAERERRKEHRLRVFSGLGLAVVAGAVVAYFFFFDRMTPEALKQDLVLIEQMKAKARGEPIPTHTFGGALTMGTRAGRMAVTAEGVPEKACFNAAWVFVNRGSVMINGVLPRRTSPNVLTELCARNASGATVRWFPKTGPADEN